MAVSDQDGFGLSCSLAAAACRGKCAVVSLAFQTRPNDGTICSVVGQPVKRAGKDWDIAGKHGAKRDAPAPVCCLAPSKLAAKFGAKS